MWAESRHSAHLFRLAMAWILFACGGWVQADEEEAPDLEFLEYLGSWEESDETWLIFTAAMDDETETDNKDKEEGSDPAPDGETLAELDDEN